MVRLQLFGSSLREEFHIYRDLPTGKPVSVSSGSTVFSPYEKNPAARVITVDTATNLPIKIDTWSINAASIETDDVSTIQATIDHSYPADLWGGGYSMPDLSPSSYSDYVEAIQSDEEVAIAYLNGAAMGDRTLQVSSASADSCDAVCRVNTACGLNYAVNEQTLMCMGYRFPFANAMYYLMGVLENPWYTPTEDDDSS